MVGVDPSLCSCLAVRGEQEYNVLGPERPSYLAVLASRPRKVYTRGHYDKLTFEIPSQCEG